MNEHPKPHITPGSAIDKILGMIYGHALGSAVGMRAEFKSKRDVAAGNLSDFPYLEAARGFKVGDWSADTDHLILVMLSLTEDDMHLNPLDIAARLKEWSLHGFAELQDTAGTGIGGTLKSIIGSAEFATNPIEIAEKMWAKSNGKLNTNGSLMRSPILGAIPDVRAVTVWSEHLSMLTHVDPQCIVSCIIQALVIHFLIYFGPTTPEAIDDLLMESLGAARGYLARVCGLGNKAQENNEKDSPQSKFDSCDAMLSQWIQIGYIQDIADLNLEDMAKISYVYKSLGCSMYALRVIKTSLQYDRVPSFKKMITKIVQEGGDTDTNAAMAGSILGAYLGYSHLPTDWVEILPHGPWLDHQIIKFIDVLQRATKKMKQNAEDHNEPDEVDGPETNEEFIAEDHNETIEPDKEFIAEDPNETNSDDDIIALLDDLTMNHHDQT